MKESTSVSLADLSIDPYPFFKQLRNTEGIPWVGSVNRWLVTRWEDVIYVDTHDDIFVAAETNSLMTRAMGLTMLRTTGDTHERLRKAAEGTLRPKDVQKRWHEMLCQVANDLIDSFIDRREVELVSEFASPFASRTLKYVLGLNSASDEDMQRWSQAFIDGIGNYADNPEVWARAEAANSEVDAVIDTSLPRVRQHPDGTVLSTMLQNDVTPPLSIEEIRSNIKLFISGGLNEPRDVISLTAWGLLNHPEQVTLVKEQPDLFKNAVEEALRWISPVAMYPRQTTRETELAGVKLPQGARLGIIIASANRDERHWKDPERFDITRGKLKNLAFGLGPHYCLGSWFAREQLGATALPILFARLPNLRLNLDYPPEFRGWVFRGATHFHVQWDV
jgi:hypothetical protein